MLKILFITSTIIILVCVILAIIVAGRSNEEDAEGVDETQICLRCKTGEYTYELDPKSEACPYVGCWKKGKCSFFVPLDKSSKMRTLKKMKRKLGKRRELEQLTNQKT